MASKISLSLITFVLLAFTKEGLAWQNDFDNYLYRVCSSTQAIYGVKSYHHNGKEDRRWYWKCRAATKQSPFKLAICYWTGYVNNYDDIMDFKCATNFVIRGVYSRHNNGREDRIWRFYCCRATYHYTRNCRRSGFVNGYDGYMNFNANSGHAIVGAFSIHDNGRE